MDKQRSTKHTTKTKDRVTRIPLKIEGDIRFSGSVSSSCILTIFHTSECLLLDIKIVKILAKGATSPNIDMLIYERTRLILGFSHFLICFSFPLCSVLSAVFQYC